MQVAFNPTARVANDADRRRIAGIVQHQFGGRWRATWDPAGGRARFERRPPMPTEIPYPLPARTHQRGRARLPVSVDEHGRQVAWEPGGYSPHALIAGATGTGKSTLLTAIVVGATHAGMDVVIVDAKAPLPRGARRPARHHPPRDRGRRHGRRHRRRPRSHHRPPRPRQGRRTTRAEDPPGHRRVPRAVRQLDEFWSDKTNRRGVTSSKHPALGHIASIADIGRELGVHLVLAAQRPDATMIQGWVRDNLTFRVSLVSSSRTAPR